MRDNRIRSIWFWEIALSGTLMSLLWPDALLWWLSAALVPLGLFMPVLDAPNQCGSCNSNTTPSAVQIDVTGLVNGGGFGSCTQCTNLNVSYIVPYRNAFAGDCRFQELSTGISCDGTAVLAVFDYSGATTFSGSLGNGPAFVTPIPWSFAFGSLQDCNDTGPFSMTYDGSGAEWCDGTGSSAVANPIP